MPTSTMKFALRFLIVATLLLTVVLFLLSSSPSYDFTRTLQLYSNTSQVSSHTNQTGAHHDPLTERAFDSSLWRQTVLANEQQAVRHEHKYGPLTDDNLVVVVQVHNRLNYLRTLVASMANVTGINSTLLVFSHDFVDPQINELIAGIEFAKVVQIFFPFSTQIWAHTYPGTSASDCSRDLAKEVALKKNCSNANYPDTYGHYRESAVTQTKHHWWWKLNTVFDQLAATKHHNGDFLFLEEDHYLMPDFVHTWRLMRQTRKRLVENEGGSVDMMTLGNYDNNYNVKINTDKLNLIEWFSSKHNMAFTIDRKLMEKLKLCSSEFCTYDDYNWDWTLQHVMQDCFDDLPLTLLSIVPRVFHVGSCGVHHKKADCSVNEQVRILEEMFTNNRDKFFPDKMSVTRRQNKKTKLVNNGGWSDPRDHQLCIQYELPFAQIIRSNPHFGPKFNLKVQ